MVPFVIKARLSSDHTSAKPSKEKKVTVDKPKNKTKKEKNQKVEIIHPENETEYVPVQHLDETKTEDQK